MPASIGAIAGIATAAGSLASGINGMVSGGGSSPAGSITTGGTSRPFSADYILPGLDRANFMFQQPDWRQTFGRSPVALSGDTQDWMNRMRAISTMGNKGAVDRGNGFLNQLIGSDFANLPAFAGLADTAAGKYLPSMMPTVSMAPPGGSSTAGLASNAAPGTPGAISLSGTGNPFLDALVTQAAQKAAGAVGSAFAGNERYGSGANANALTTNVFNASAGVLSPIYESERNRQLQASGMLTNAQLAATGLAPQLENAQFTVPMLQASALQQIGSLQDQRAQQEQDSQLTAMNNYLQMVNGSPVGSSTTSSQPYWNGDPWSRLLGSALMGGGSGGWGKLFSGMSGGDSSSPGMFSTNGFFGSNGPIFGSPTPVQATPEALYMASP